MLLLIFPAKPTEHMARRWRLLDQLVVRRQQRSITFIVLLVLLDDLGWLGDAVVVVVMVRKVRRRRRRRRWIWSGEAIVCLFGGENDK